MRFTCSASVATHSTHHSTAVTEVDAASCVPHHGYNMAPPTPPAGPVPQGDGDSSDDNNMSLLTTTLGHLDIDLDIRPYTPPPRPDTEPGIFCKNLLLKDRKAQYYLVTFREDKQLDLKNLKQQVGAHRNFSFASAQELREVLNGEAGCVSPFCLINDSQDRVKFLLDSDLVAASELLNFHPFDPTLTSLLSSQNLQRFCQRLNKPIIPVLC